MAILGKVRPSAGVNALLYKVPDGKQAIFTVKGVNTSPTVNESRIYTVKANDFSVAEISVTASGYGYTSKPDVTITGSNTTAATAVVGNMKLTLAAISAAGSGYTPGDVLTLVGGTGTAAQVRIDSTNASGGVAAFSIWAAGSYSVLPTGTVSVTGGTGSGASFAGLEFGILTVNITKGGNGYAAAPTVTIAGGTGFAATAVMTTTVELTDVFDVAPDLGYSGFVECNGILLHAGDSVFCSATGGTMTFTAIGVEEIA